MDPGDLEALAVETYERHRLDPSEPVATARIARLELGDGAIVRAHMTTSGPAVLFWHNGKRRIGLKRGLSLPYALFFVGHEVAHVVLEREHYVGDDIEAACDYLGAALIAPRPAAHRLYRAVGLDLKAIAAETRSTQTWAALRIGEVERIPLAAISPASVRVRGPEEWVWPDAATLRAWGSRGRPGLRKVQMTDGRGRLALVGTGE